MKLSEYAKKVGVRYETAWRWFKSGKIRGFQIDTGTVIITEERGQEPTAREEMWAVYTRVSANENRPNLDSQADRLVAYCTAKGKRVHKVVKEIGSGVNDARPKLLKLLADTSVTVIVVEHKDRLTRFGFKYIETLLATQNRRIEVVNLADNAIEDILADLTSIVYSFCARLYGQRRAKRKTEKIVTELQAKADAAEEGAEEAADTPEEAPEGEEQAPAPPETPQVDEPRRRGRKSSKPPEPPPETPEAPKPRGRGRKKEPTPEPPAEPAPKRKPGRPKRDATHGAAHPGQERLPL